MCVGQKGVELLVDELFLLKGEVDFEEKGAEWREGGFVGDVGPVERQREVRRDGKGLDLLVDDDVADNLHREHGRPADAERPGLGRKLNAFAVDGAKFHCVSRGRSQAFGDDRQSAVEQKETPARQDKEDEKGNGV